MLTPPEMIMSFRRPHFDDRGTRRENRFDLREQVGVHQHHLGRAVAEHVTEVVGVPVPVRRDRNRTDRGTGEGGLDEAGLVAHHQRVSVTVPRTERGQRRGQGSGARPYLRVGTDVVAATYDCFGRRHRIPSVLRTMQRASTATRPSSVTRSGLTSSDSIQPWHAAARCPKPTRRSASCARCQGSDPR